MYTDVMEKFAPMEGTNEEGWHLVKQPRKRLHLANMRESLRFVLYHLPVESLKKIYYV